MSCLFLFYVFILVLALESQHKGSITPSVRSPVVAEERMCPGWDYFEFSSVI